MKRLLPYRVFEQNLITKNLGNVTISQSDESINEGIRDMMTPKSTDEIISSLRNLPTEQVVKLVTSKRMKMTDFFSTEEIDRMKGEMIEHIVGIIKSKGGSLNLLDLERQQMPVTFDIKYQPNFINQSIYRLNEDHVEVSQYDIRNKKRLPGFTVKYCDLELEILADIKHSLDLGLTPKTREEIMNDMKYKKNLELYRLWKKEPESKIAVCAFDELSNRADKDVTARSTVNTIKNSNWHDNFYKKNKQQ